MSRLVTRFRRLDRLPVVEAQIQGSGGVRHLQLVLDTAASATLIRPSVLEEIGCGRAPHSKATSIRSALGKEPGFLVKVPRFWALGFTVLDYEVHGHELPDQYDIDGLLGMTFLDDFDYTIRSMRNEIVVEPAVP